MKFTMYKKETEDIRYREDPYRAVNFGRDSAGNPVCPDGRKFIFKYTQHVYRNKYGRTEEVYECESCEGCTHKRECCPKTLGNRTIRMNRELTSFHKEVVSNLESVHGALLKMNRSIQAEGLFGILKWDRSYKRLFRRGRKNALLELTLISCGFNLYKYYNKKQRMEQTAWNEKVIHYGFIKCACFSMKSNVLSINDEGPPERHPADLVVQLFRDFFYSSLFYLEWLRQTLHFCMICDSLMYIDIFLGDIQDDIW